MFSQKIAFLNMARGFRPRRRNSSRSTRRQAISPVSSDFFSSDSDVTTDVDDATCRNYARTGRCRYGNHCHFDHPKHSKATTRSKASRPSAGKRTSVCFHWRDEGESF